MSVLDIHGKHLSDGNTLELLGEVAAISTHSICFNEEMKKV